MPPYFSTSVASASNAPSLPIAPFIATRAPLRLPPLANSAGRVSIRCTGLASLLRELAGELALESEVELRAEAAAHVLDDRLDRVDLSPSSPAAPSETPNVACVEA